MSVMRAIALAALLTLAVMVGAQDTEPVDCGFQYTVVRGDTVAKIAERCGVTVTGIQTFNNVGTVIYPDQILYMPPPNFEPQVTLSPIGGPIGTQLTASLGGFPPTATLRVGLGAANEAALIDTTVVTTAQGEAIVRFTIPTNVDASGQLIVSAVTTDGRFNATSDVFEVGPVPPTPTPAPTLVPSAGTGGGEVAATAQTVALDAAQLAPSTAPVQLSAVGPLFDAVNVYMALPANSDLDGLPVACDARLVAVEVPVDLTVAPLTAGIDALLDNSAASYGLPGVQNPLAEMGWLVDQIVIVNGEAVINLTAESMPSVAPCTAALVEAQLQATALQYATVDSVSVYINENGS